MKTSIFLVLISIGLFLVNITTFAEINKIEELRAKISKNPNNEILYVDLGDVLLREGRLQEAINEYTNALKINSSCLDAVFQRGFAYMKLKEISKAIDDFNYVIKLNPNDELAYSNLGVIYRDKKDYIKAIQNCEKALKIKKTASNYYNISLVYMDMGDTEKARENFNKVIAMAGHDSSLGELAAKKLEELRALEPKPTGPTLGYEGYIPSIDEAVEIASSWLELIDEEKYVEGWETSAEYLRNIIDKEKWVQSLNAVRTPLGKVVSRTLKSKEYTKTMIGAPDGEYVVIQYETSFENKKSAIETITPMADKDGKWKISGYYIR